MPLLRVIGSASHIHPCGGQLNCVISAKIRTEIFRRVFRAGSGILDFSTRSRDEGCFAAETSAC